jgi:hypothetical protein
MANKIIERGLEGAAIGSKFGPLGSAIGGGLGVLEGGLEGWWDRWKQGKQNRWQQNELLRKFNAIEQAGRLETQAEQDAINRQLELSQKNLASTMAVSGGIRTGNYQRKVGELNRYAVEDVARIAREKALQVEQMKSDYQAGVQSFNLGLAQLESAKASGDANQIGASAENLAPLIYDFIAGKYSGKQGELEEFGPTLPVNPPFVGEEYGNLAPANPALDYIRRATRLTTPANNPFTPNVDYTDPVSVLWGY